MILHKIAIASDHKGYDLKTKVIEMLKQSSHKIIDLGTNDENVVDYPDYANSLCEYMLSNSDIQYGILICSTGIGMSISANRYSGIRAALVTTTFMAENARLHNDANVLVLGAKVLDDEANISLVQKFISTSFEGGRHIQRLSKIS